MRFAIFKGEKTVADLASRLFRVQGRGSQAATKQTADALLKANPHLKDMSKVAPGSLIAIPDAAPPVAPGEDAISVGLVRSATSQNIQTALDTLQKRLDDIETKAAVSLKSGTDRLQTSEVRAALKAAADTKVVFPAPATSLDAITKHTKEIFKNIQTAQEARTQALTQLRSVLTSFARR